MIAGLGQNQISSYIRIAFDKKAYHKGQPDLIIMNAHKKYNDFCIEFKSPTCKYKISDAQKEMKHKYNKNGYKSIIGNDYDQIIRKLILCMAELV